MSSETRKMSLTNHRLKDKKSLSQKLIVRNTRFLSIGTVKLCVITDVYWTGLRTLRLGQLLRLELSGLHLSPLQNVYGLRCS